MSFVNSPSCKIWFRLRLTEKVVEEFPHLELWSVSRQKGNLLRGPKSTGLERSRKVNGLDGDISYFKRGIQ